MKRFNKIIGGFQTVIDKLDRLKEKCNGEAMKIAGQIDDLHGDRVDQIQEGLLAKAAADNLREIFPQPEKTSGGAM